MPTVAEVTGWLREPMQAGFENLNQPAEALEFFGG